jgi:hypothetical protein
VSNVRYFAKLKGYAELKSQFRLTAVTADADLVMVALPSGQDPVPYFAREGEEGSEQPEGLGCPVLFFRREGNFRLYKGAMRATYRFFERRDPPEAKIEYDPRKCPRCGEHAVGRSPTGDWCNSCDWSSPGDDCPYCGLEEIDPRRHRCNLPEDRK